MDRVDELAEKVVEAFEPLSEIVVLEQIAVPEDPDLPDGEIDLWIASTKSYDLADDRSIILRGTASLSVTAAETCDREELSFYLREQILGSEEFRSSQLAAEVAAKSYRKTGETGPNEASLN